VSYNGHRETSESAAASVKMEVACTLFVISCSHRSGRLSSEQILFLWFALLAASLNEKPDYGTEI
jgi:hypothetical protein